MAVPSPKKQSFLQKQKQTLLERILLNQHQAIHRLKKYISEAKKKISNSKQETENYKRDMQYLNKVLIRMNNLLNHVYSHDMASSRGMKLLILYYRQRDHWLPIGTRRRKAFERLVSALNLDKITFKSPIDIARLSKLKAFKNGAGHAFQEHEQRYHEWISRHEPGEAEKSRQRETAFKIQPTLSVIVPVFNTPKIFLQELLVSMLRQTYSRWELCLAVAGEQKEKLAQSIESLCRKDPRIKFKLLEKNLGIAENSNQALTLATGEYVTFMDHDDRLPEFALHEIVKAINQNPELELIYSDEDKISPNGKKRFDPHFKPDFSLDTLRSYNYICHLCVIKKSLLKKIRGFRLGFEGSQDYDLILRAVDNTRHIAHIPKILYHWRMHETSTAYSYHTKTYALESAQKALRDHLKRNHLPGTVSNGMLPTTYLVKYPIHKNPKVAIIIPTLDQPAVLQKCLGSILEKTAYKNYRIYLVDTGSKQKETFQLYRTLAKNHANLTLLKKIGDFNFSVVNNYAVKHCREKFLLFLNNDMEVINPDWLGNMLEHAQRKEIGAVGAKLYYPDDTIQHGGVILGIRGIAGHAHKSFSNYDPGYFFRLKIVQNLSAVTAACLMTRREVFTQCGGFDEKYKLAFGDVDLCLKIRKKNHSIVWTPYAELYHFESKTRGYEDTPDKQTRFKTEIDLFKQKWGKELSQGDPCYNPNLTLLHEDFSIKTSAG